jgi:acetolactate decarboxylase
MLCACLPGSSPAQTAPAVRVFGAVREMIHEGRTGSRVALASLADAPHLYGLGAQADLNGEILILDGDIILARPGGKVERVMRATDAAAALLVVAEVDTWQSFVLTEDISWKDLDAVVEQHLRDDGRDAQTRVPFQIIGTFPSLSWHVVDGSRLHGPITSHEDHLRAADRMRANGVEARLLGFYSAHDQGVFTHAGSRTHVHGVLEDPLRMGHIDDAAIAAGSVLLLPRQDDLQATRLVDRMLDFLGPAAARDAVHSLTTEAACSGPDGSFRTLVRSRRPDGVYFEQESERGTSHVWSLPERTWTRTPKGDVANLPDDVRARLRGHEFHLQLLEFPQRFAGYRLRGTESTLTGKDATRIDMRDETGRAASVWIDPETGEPVQLEMNPEGAQGALRLTYHVWKERDGVQWFRGFVLNEGEDRVFRYRYTTIQPNDVPGAFFRQPDRSASDVEDERP